MKPKQPLGIFALVQLMVGAAFTLAWAAWARDWTAPDTGAATAAQVHALASPSLYTYMLASAAAALFAGTTKLTTLPNRAKMTGAALIIILGLMATEALGIFEGDAKLILAMTMPGVLVVYAFRAVTTEVPTQDRVNQSGNIQKASRNE